MRTLQAAFGLVLGGLGTVVMMPGDYIDETLNVAGMTGVEIQAEAGTEVLLGERVDTFTLHGGSTWKANIATVIPADADTRNWVFEWGTPEGLLDGVNSAFAPTGRTHRLQHFRLKRGASKDTLAAGEFFFETGTLYIRRTDSTDPNGSDYWIPDQSGKSLITGGHSGCDVTIDGVIVRFGAKGVDLSNVATYALTDCLFFGNSVTGFYYNGSGTTGTEDRCEYAANANDGRAATAPSALSKHLAVITDGWYHDNGDEGASDHQPGCWPGYVGGLSESNASSGMTFVQNAKVSVSDLRTRNNPVGMAASINQDANSNTIIGWISEGDTYAASATSNSTLNLQWCTITAPVTAALYAGSPGDVINAAHTSGVTTPRAGGGTFNVT